MYYRPVGTGDSLVWGERVANTYSGVALHISHLRSNHQSGLISKRIESIIANVTFWDVSSVPMGRKSDYRVLQAINDLPKVTRVPMGRRRSTLLSYNAPPLQALSLFGPAH
jgi:hypothetical protein